MMTREEAIKELETIKMCEVDTVRQVQALDVVLSASAPSAGSSWRGCGGASGNGTMKKSEVRLKESKESGDGGALSARLFCQMISMTLIIRQLCAFVNGAARP